MRKFPIRGEYKSFKYRACPSINPDYWIVWVRVKGRRNWVELTRLTTVLLESQGIGFEKIVIEALIDYTTTNIDKLIQDHKEVNNIGNKNRY